MSNLLDLEAKDPEDLYLFNDPNRPKEIQPNSTNHLQLIRPTIDPALQKIRIEPYKPEKKLFQGSLTILKSVEPTLQGVNIEFCIGNEFHNMVLSKGPNNITCFEAEIEQNKVKYSGHVYRIVCKSEFKPLMYLPNIGELIYLKFKLFSNVVKQMDRYKFDLRYSLSKKNDFYISFMEDILIIFLHIVNINDIICLTKVDIFIKK